MSKLLWIIVGVGGIAIVAAAGLVARNNLTCSSVSGNGTTTIANMRSLATAQSTFKRTDWYGHGKPGYARTAAHLYSIAPGLDPHLIDRAFMNAFVNGPAGAAARPKAGYLFIDLTPGATSALPRAGDPPVCQFAYCGYPAKYGVTETRTFIIDSDTKTVYAKDTGGTPVSAVPADLTGWQAIGD
jgi:hypothetical protein